MMTTHPKQYTKRLKDVKRTPISYTTANYMDCSEDIYSFEHNYHQSKYESNEQMKQASNQVVKDLNWKKYMVSKDTFSKI